MVLYRIEIHPPLLHLSDPTTLILHISGSAGSWKETIHFNSHDPVKQVSFSMILKTQIVRDCQSFQPGVRRLTLPLANRYIFSGPARNTCDGRATMIFELVLSPVYVKICEFWPSPLRNQVHAADSGHEERL
ncbi:hypothetical protein PHET_03060 [Paragonimus heterotremus]|uniref:Uncharacterized protein n=1 Tax=Paragonimus heterotremus TaxID=100268 RepID=A0A8J4TKG4_9TREM|nr:hypothetical protein PHET_03060 [Paragonimus heterotremus]